MQKRKDTYEIDDFLTDESFINWIKSGENNQFWENYSSRFPQQEEKFNSARLIVQNLKFEEKQFSGQTIETIKQKIDASIALEKSKQLKPLTYKNEQSRSLALYYKIAASLIFIMLISYFAYQNFSTDKTVSETKNLIEYNLKETQRGQKLTIYLNDGTKVRLNYESSLRFPKHFSDSSRIVYLSGEAYFEVAHDETRPFKVITSQITTQVLGTTFNINAYPHNETADVALVSGKVAVTPSEESDNFEPRLLNPGQTAIFHRRNKQLELQEYNPAQVLAWKDGIIVFNNANQKEVFSRLEKWYGLEFNVVNSSGENWRYTGRFDNLTLDAILTSLSFVKNFEYAIKNDKVLIRYNN